MAERPISQAEQWGRPVVTGAVVLVALLAGSSCSTERSPTAIFDARVSDGGTSVAVGVDFCGNVSVDVEETDTQVELTAFGGSDAGGDCASGATVRSNVPSVTECSSTRRRATRSR